MNKNHGKMSEKTLALADGPNQMALQSGLELYFLEIAALLCLG